MVPDARDVGCAIGCTPFEHVLAQRGYMLSNKLALPDWLTSRKLGCRVATEGHVSM